MKIKGVDISVWQKNIDYKKLKAKGVKFAILRAGYGVTEDSELAKHIKGCIENDIAFGFYWYSYAHSLSEVKREAKACLAVLCKYPNPSYPVFFDMEEKSQIDRLDNTTRTSLAIAFCTAIRNGGYPCGIYTNPAWLENYYEKELLIGEYDIWLAHWTDSPDKESRYDYGQKMWQWGVDHIGMNVDGDICFVDYPAITAKWYEGLTQPVRKTIDELANEVLKGLWDNGAEREKLLTEAGYNYSAVQNRVNEILYGEKVQKKSVDEIAREVILGKWGNGKERVKRLAEAGYNYSEVQNRVNEILM